MPSVNKTVTRLYDGDVELTFNPKSTKYRYTVSDRRTGEKDVTVRGVTSVLKGILDKPELMRWPMNMSHQLLFGAKFDETLKDYTHDWDKAVIQPSKAYSADELHEAMKEGSRAHTKRSDRGKDIGTLGHSVIENYLSGEEYPVRKSFEENGIEPDEETVRILEKIVTRFDKWWKSLKNPEVVFMERPIYSRRLKYCGTLDLVIRVGDKSYVMDFKTTNRSTKAPLGIYPEMFLQLGLYGFALREETGLMYDDMGIISITKDGEFAVMTASDMNMIPENCETAAAFGVRLHDWLIQAEGSLSNAPKGSHLNPLASQK